MNLKVKTFNPPPVIKAGVIWSTVCKCGVAVLLFFIMVGCGPSRKINTNILYFQKDLDSLETVQVKENIIKTNDILNIQIFSKSLIQDQAAIFNLPDKTISQGYTVRNDGNIEIPLLGTIRAAGLTKIQLQTSIEEKLTNYIKNPSVMVRLAQFNINILGEVRSPGSHSFQTETVTLIDAISAAGDLTDQGKREDITVIREENLVRKIYKVDLRSGTLFLSPVFQMQPNDIVYVGANVKKLRALNTGPDRMNGLQLTSTLLSIFSTAIFLTYFIIKNN